MGCPYDAVGMQRALDSAIGLPSRPTSASWMLVFLMPADVRRSFIVPSLPLVVRVPVLRVNAVMLGPAFMRTGPALIRADDANVRS